MGWMLRRPKQNYWFVFGYLSLALVPSLFGGETDRTTLVYGIDQNIKMVMKGRAGNLELQASEQPQKGYATTRYQEGAGYAAYDRRSQIFKWETRIGFTLNRLSEHIKKVAPYMEAFVPRGAELDFLLDMTNVGYATLDFEHLNINRFKLDVNYGDVDVRFPSINQSIVRGVARFHLMTGDLEIYQLGNLKAAKIKINGGIGELFVDFGPKIHKDMNVTLDHDIGKVELQIPRGTRVAIHGTTRDLSEFGLQKHNKTWLPASYHSRSPTLKIKIKGPLGDLKLVWTE